MFRPQLNCRLKTGDRSSCGKLFLAVPSREVEIANKLGLHLRAAAALVQFAESYPCKVTLAAEGGRSANGKSILSVLSIGAVAGMKLVLETSGEKEEEALEAIAKFIADRFGEAE